MREIRNNITEHFENVARDYDYWKNKNRYYYNILKSIAARYTVGRKNILDAGCGTGDILLSLNAQSALGIDISSAMIAIAKEKSIAKNDISFLASDIATFSSSKKFDAILFFDVIEHLVYPEKTLRSLGDLLTENGIIILTMANLYWEPILLLAEKLGLKMPEGPHYRISSKNLMAIAGKNRLKIIGQDWFLLFPKYIFAVSWLLNNIIGRLPIIKRLSIIQLFIFGKLPASGPPEGAKETLNKSLPKKEFWVALF